MHRSKILMRFQRRLPCVGRIGNNRFLGISRSTFDLQAVLDTLANDGRDTRALHSRAAIFRLRKRPGVAGLATHD